MRYQRVAMRYAVLMWTIGLALGSALTVGQLTVAQLAQAAPAAPAASATPNTKFYIVKSPDENNGQQETLFTVAERTLGDGTRFTEIMSLNAGRTLPNGTVFTQPEQLVPGFALRLPDDAGGPDVQVGTLPQTQPSAAASPTATAAGSSAASSSGGGSSLFGGQFSIPTLVAGLAGVTLLTVLIVARRPVARATRRIASALRRAARPLRPRLPRALSQSRLRRRRAALGRTLAADTHTLPDVRNTLRELSRLTAPIRVYSVLAIPNRLLAAVTTTAPAPEPWTAVDSTRWERSGLTPDETGETGETGEALPYPHLARIGVTERGHAQVLVDLGQINGSLSILGDLRVAQDTLAAIVRGLLEAPNRDTPIVTIDPERVLLPEFHAAHGLLRVRTLKDITDDAPVQLPAPAPELGLDLIRTAARRPGRVAGLLVLPKPPGEDDLAALAHLTSPAVGWIVLTVGSLPGSHWRWNAFPDGTLHTGVLGHKVFVPVG
jgi:hypothetical protein